VDPRTVLAAVVKRRISSLHRESNPRIPIVQLVAKVAKIENNKFARNRTKFSIS
jgi:hypothetical protein